MLGKQLHWWKSIFLFLGVAIILFLLMECGSNSDANIDLSKSVNLSGSEVPMAKTALSFMPTRWGWNQIIYEAAFWKSLKGCTSIRVKEEGTCKQIIRGTVMDLSLGCNWNFPEESSLQRTSWVSNTESPEGKKKKSFNLETLQHYSEICLSCDLLSRKSQPQTGPCGKAYCIFSQVRALPLVPRELSVRPGQGLLFSLESETISREVSKKNKSPFIQPGKVLEDQV